MECLRGLRDHLRQWNCFSKRESPLYRFQLPLKNTGSESSQFDDKSVSVIISHGAFHTTWHYQSFMDALEARPDFARALCPQQSASGPNPPSNSFEQDVQTLRRIVRNELLSGRDVLLVGHSYGGIPGCDALADLDLPKDDHDIGRVMGIVFVSAFVAEAGQSLLTAKLPEGADRASWVRVEGALSYADNAGSTFYNLVNPRSHVNELVSRLVPQSSASFVATTKHETWKDYPCYYVRCSQDRAMELREQNHYIARLTNGCSRTTVKDVFADHAPFASMPEELADVFVEIARELKESGDAGMKC